MTKRPPIFIPLLEPEQPYDPDRDLFLKQLSDDKELDEYAWAFEAGRDHIQKFDDIEIADYYTMREESMSPSRLDEGNDMYFGLWSDGLIGGASVHPNGNEYRLQFWLEDDMVGQGNACLAVSSLTNYILAYVDKKIVAHVDPENERAIATLHRCGFGEVAVSQEGNAVFGLLKQAAPEEVNSMDRVEASEELLDVCLDLLIDTVNVFTIIDAQGEQKAVVTVCEQHHDNSMLLKIRRAVPASGSGIYECDEDITYMISLECVIDIDQGVITGFSQRIEGRNEEDLPVDLRLVEPNHSYPLRETDQYIAQKEHIEHVEDDLVSGHDTMSKANLEEILDILQFVRAKHS